MAERNVEVFVGNTFFAKLQRIFAYKESNLYFCKVINFKSRKEVYAYFQ